MYKTIFLILTGIAFGFTSVYGAKQKKPNILIIMADDMGYSDAGCYGSEIQTPNLDKLASDGIRFAQFYNTGRCWPSRTSILSGYYPQSIRRDKFSNIQLDKDHPVMGNPGVRPRWAQLLPVYLKPLGYRSYVSGKWHIDGEPLKNGFDHSFLTSNEFGFFRSTNDSEDDIKQPPVPIASDNSSYSTIRTADFAIKFLKEHAEKYAGKPFFQYLAFHAPHFPLHALTEDIAIYRDRFKTGWDVIRQERYERMKQMGIVNCPLSPLNPETIPSWNFPEAKLKEMIGENEVAYAVPWNSLTPGQKDFQAEKMAVHAAMIHRMDIEIGRVLDQIKSMSVLDNTLIIFISDNGASAEQIIRGDMHDKEAPVGSAKTYLGMGPGWSSAANTPLRLHKSWNHEGGISTPFIVCWPAGIKSKGELRQNPGHLIDVVPTLLEITGVEMPEEVAGLKVPPLPGKSLVPVFKKDNSVKHDYLWWNHEGNRAIRVADWKLVADHSFPWELYDLSTDRSETRNLAGEYPEKVEELEQLWFKHAEEFRVLSKQDLPVKTTDKK